MHSKKMSILETERGILLLKRWFEDLLAEKLELYRVSAPIFINPNSGIQDNLNGIERPVSFCIPELNNQNFEIVQSLAKWKRLALAKYNIPIGKGLYTDMNALRPDESNLRTGIHSIYVDQWDWEKSINATERTLKTLKDTVTKIYEAIIKTEELLSKEFDLQPFLNKNITFIHSQDLLDEYPNLSAKERENAACKKYGSVFLIGIGGVLSNGVPHDGRSPDYDDWSTACDEKHYGLNGDILVWNPFIDSAFELSSMGIRVDKESLLHQLKIRNDLKRAELPWHQMLLNEQMPLSIGGGIGQSRLSMLLLHKQHIGEVQSSCWPDEVLELCQRNKIDLL